MRIPHTILTTTYEVYKPSNASLNLEGENERTLKSENFTWDAELPPSLVTWCVYSLVENFKEKPILNELPSQDKDLLLETLPTDLPLPLSVPLLDDGIYWKRCSENRWQSMNYIRDHGNSWKRLYLERHLQEYLELLHVEEYVLSDVTDLTALCSPYVHRLSLRQLQMAHPTIHIDSDGDECLSENVFLDHINLEPVIKGLVNLEEIHITFGVRNCAMDFTWNLFKFSTADCSNIGFGIESTQNLTVLRIHRSNLDDPRAATLLEFLVKNMTLLELDFSHCKLGDSGAMAVGKLMTVHPTLTKINLCNNRIGPEGAKGLAFALLEPRGCPLDFLSLRMNLIGEEGATHLCAGLAKSRRPRELILAGCGIGEGSIIRIGQMLQQNCTLQCLDLSNNHLGEVGGEALELGMQENETMYALDVRMTDLPAEKEFIINQIITKNYEKFKKLQRDTEDAARNKDEEFEMNRANYDAYST